MSMRHAALLVLLLACSETKVAIPPEASVAPPPAPTASVVEVDASTPEPTATLPTEAAIQAIFKGKNTKGVVAVSIDGTRGSYSIGAPVSPDRALLVASFTKLWVAVATLRFVARKELSLDDPIKTLLPELKSKPWSDSTVRDLLSHTSRVPEFDNGFFSRTDVDFSHAAATLAKEVSASTEKSGVWKYRNSEYAILGAILEARTGQPAADVLKREVFDVAGMKHAGLAIGKRAGTVDFTPMGRVRPENFFTAGAGYASPHDLLAFFEALQAAKLLDEESKKLLFDGNPRNDRAALGCWAYPYATSDGGTTLLVERPGSFGNVKLVTAFYPDLHRAIVFWTGEGTDVGKPRTKDSIAFKLAHVVQD